MFHDIVLCDENQFDRPSCNPTILLRVMDTNLHTHRYSNPKRASLISSRLTTTTTTTPRPSTAASANSSKSNIEPKTTTKKALVARFVNSLGTPIHAFNPVAQITLGTHAAQHNTAFPHLSLLLYMPLSSRAQLPSHPSHPQKNHIIIHISPPIQSH